MILHAALAIAHLLLGAAWFGAMCYSAFVLQPRAKQFFDKDSDFEAFITTVSHGARWKVLGILALITLTGLGLLGIGSPADRPAAWWTVLLAKFGIILAAVGLFVYVSWRLWPARVLATPGEIPHFQRAFRYVAGTMIVMAVMGLALGVVLAHIR